MGILIPNNIPPEIALVFQQVSIELDRLRKQLAGYASVKAPAYTGGGPKETSKGIPDGDIRITGNLQVDKDATVDGYIYGSLDHLTDFDYDRELYWKTTADYLGRLEYPSDVKRIDHLITGATPPALAVFKDRLALCNSATPSERLRLLDKSGYGAIELGSMQASPSVPGTVSYDSSNNKFLGRYSDRILPFTAIIDNDLTLNVPEDFATIADAFDFLRNKYIKANVYVTISLADGTHTMSSGLTFRHPCATNIRVYGRNVLTNTVTSVVSVTGSRTARSVVLQLGETPVMPVNSIIGITNASGGTYPTYLQGAHKVTAVDPVLNRITISFLHASTDVPDGAITATITYYPATITGTTTPFFTVPDQMYAEFKYVTIVAGASDLTGFSIARFGLLLLQNSNMFGFYYCANVYQAGFLYITSSCLGAALTGYTLNCYHHATVYMNGSVLNSGNRGFQCYDMVSLYISGSYITGQGSYGANVMRRSLIRLQNNSIVDGCYGTGINLTTGSYAFLTAGGVSQNNRIANFNPPRKRLGVQCSYADDSSLSDGYSGGADALYVTNVHVTRGANLTDNTPAPPSDTTNVDWLYTASNPTQISAHVHFNEINHNKLLNYTKVRHGNHASIIMRARHSITGGGDITASRQFMLVNDLENPGGWTVYGTNASGIKGWLQASHLVRMFGATGGGGGGGGGDGDKVLINNVRVTNAANFVDGAAATNCVYVKWTSAGASPNTVKGYVLASLIDHNKLNNYSATQHIDHSSVGWRGIYSLTGGGDLSASRTISLVNDEASPGAWKVYGTNASGIRRWRPETETMPYLLLYLLMMNTAFVTWESEPYLGMERTLKGRWGIDTRYSTASFIVSRAPPNKYFEIYEDFTYPQSVTYFGGFTRTYGGTGAGTGVMNDPGGHPGILLLNVGTTSSGYSIIRTDVGAFALGRQDGYIRFETCIYMAISSTSTQRFYVLAGFTEQVTNTLNGAGINYLCFRYRDNWSSGRFEAYLRNTAVGVAASIVKNTGVKFASKTWYRLRIDLFASQTKADFYIDDVKVATIYRHIRKSTVASCLNNVAAHVGMIKQVGTTARSLAVDYIGVMADISNGRG